MLLWKIGIALILHTINKSSNIVWLISIQEGENMSEIKREELLRKLDENADPLRLINDEAVDFVLWKLNEIKQEVGLMLKNRSERTDLRDSA